MDYKEFVHAVSERAGLSRQEAQDLTRATLQTLAERLSGTEAVHLAMQLPEELQEYVRTKDKQAERFGRHEFVRRVREHTGLTEAETTSGIRAVMATLREAISGEELDHVMSQLPGEFSALTTPAS
jgi:uncharacterized protein (DUF2267 family)